MNGTRVPSRHGKPGRRWRWPLGVAAVAVVSLLLPVGGAVAAIKRTFDAEHASITQDSGGRYLSDNGYRFPLLARSDGTVAWPALSTEQAESGSYSVKTRINASSYARSEVLVQEAATLGQRHALGFSVFVPAGHVAPAGTQWQIFHQVWQTPCNPPVIAFDLQPNTTNPLWFRVLIRNDTRSSASQAPITIYKGPLPQGRWVQFAMEFNADPRDPYRAYFHLYMDRKQLPMNLGQTDTIGYYTKAGCASYPARRALDLRVGLYRGGGWWNPTSVMYYDDARFGDTISDVMR